MRPTKEEYYLKIALDVAMRSTCRRSAYGAVIVRNDRIISTGYNGAPRQAPNCIDVGVCAREGIESRTRYELCRAVHAEQNALLNAFSRDDLVNARIYIAGFNARIFHEYGDVVEKMGPACNPCMMCYRQMVNARIAEVCLREESGKAGVYPLEAFSFLDRMHTMAQENLTSDVHLCI